MTVGRFILQRLTAGLMIPLVAGHLILIHYATSRGLSAAEILSRTRGSMLALLYYGLFSLLVSAHAAVGARTLLAEWTPIEGRTLDVAMWIIGIGLASLGVRAVAAVVLPW
jgi:fumarate reductase subunit C